ncbi:MAG: EpsG family protein [Oscillospiraceae bacterium]|nr:EpsG family protein [Oscillospiraceae bacterium]
MGSFINFLQSTMLIERLVGVTVYALVLGYFYNKIRHAKSPQMISRYLNRYLIVLCIMAFFYIPGTSADLYRWRALAEPWKNTSFSWFWTRRVILSPTPLGYLLIYICQMTGIDGLLPMVCALGYFGNLFHIFKCEAYRDNFDFDSLAVTLLFVMSFGTFLEVISGIRCMLSFSIVLRCVYDEMYERKHFVRNIPLYIIAALLHNAAIPLIGVRLVCAVFEQKRNAVLTMLNILVAAATFFLAIRLGNDYIESAFAKADSYTSQNIYAYSWEYVIAAIGWLVLLPVLWRFRKWYPEAWAKEKNALRYLLIVLAGDILFIGTYSVFHRYFAAALTVSVPLLTTFLNCERAKERFRARQTIVLFSLLILFLACARGNLCGYKFFQLHY